jgi:hypothetical protein
MSFRIVGPPKAILRPITKPLYDTFFPEQELFEATLFTDFHRFESGKLKTTSDTNMVMFGQLPVPQRAEWSYLRLYFQSQDGDAIRRFYDTATIKLMVDDQPLVGPVSPDVFTPIIPRTVTNDDSSELIVQEFVKRKCRKGELLTPWPWLEAPIHNPMTITHGQDFKVIFSGSNRLPGNLRIKVILGPTLLVPL